MWEILLLVIPGLGLWFFVDGLRSREAAIRIAKDACARQGLQFLDDSVHGAGVRLGRDANGRMALVRIFAFDFSDDGFSRRTGRISMLGEEAETLQLEPYRVV